MIHQPPVEADPLCVTIGIPVYNGEGFLREALQSVLAQSYEHYRVLISDNASQDGTKAICEEFARLDDRITYSRQERNLGAVANFNLLAREASTPLFMWLAHDDQMLPEYLSACVSSLRSNAGAVLAFTAAEVIGEACPAVERPLFSPDLGQLDSVGRFERLLDPIPYGENITYGLIRREALLKTQLHGDFGGGDRAMFAELALYGNFSKVGEVLFLRRAGDIDLTPEEVEAYNRGDVNTAVLREWRILRQNVRSILRSPLPLRQRLRLLGKVIERLLVKRRTYAGEAWHGLNALVSRWD